MAPTQPPAKRGRPADPDRKVPTTTWLTTRDHARLLELAHQRRRPLSAVVRDLLARTFK